MDPKDLQALLAKVQLASQKGVSPDVLDQYVYEQSQGALSSVADLQKQAGISTAPNTNVNLRNIARSAGMGATFGWLDELAGLWALAKKQPGAMLKAMALESGGPVSPGAAVAPVVLSNANAQAGDPYTKERDAVRNNYAAFKAAHPVVNGVSEVAGSLAIPVGGELAAGGKGAMEGAGLLSTLLRGAGTSAAAAGTSSLGYAPDLSPESMKRAGLATVAGGALGLGMAGAGRWISSLRNSNAGARLVRALQDGGGVAPLEAADAAMTAAGRGGIRVPADLSPRLQQLADFAANNNPDVRATYLPQLETRGAGQGGRLMSDLTDLFGSTPDAAAKREALVAARRAIANGPDGYDALNRAAGQITDPRLIKILRRPVVRGVFNDAVRTGDIAGLKEQIPNFRTLNELRQALDDAANKAFTSGATNRGAALRAATDELTGIMEDNVPGFRALQDQYRVASAPINAMDDAAKMLKTVDVRQLQRTMAGMTPDAQDAFRHTLASGMVDDLNATATNRNVAQKFLFASPDMEAKMRVVFGDEPTFQQWMDRVRAERAMAMTRDAFGNSLTHFRDMEAGGVSEGLRTYATPGHIMPELMGRIPLFTSRQQAGRAAAKMAPLLFKQGMPLQDFLQAIRELAAQGNAGPLSRTYLPAVGGSLLGQQ